MGEESRFDEVLLNLAAQSGGIEPLLKSFFSFLHRKTDFYVVADFKPGSNVSMGFPPGGAERILLKAFRSLPYKPLEGNSPPQAPPAARGSAPATSKAQAPPTAPPVSAGSTKGASTSNTPPLPQRSSITASKEGERAEGGGHGAGGGAGVKKSTPPAVQLTESGKQVPISNGGVTEKYYWTQSLNDVTVYVDVPKGTRSRDLVCEITASRLKVGIKGRELLLDGTMPGTVKVQDSLWTLESTETVVVTLDKTVPTWWACVIQGDPEIDTTQVDSTMKVEEYDPETQGAIRKIMFDQRQKAMGLPTSDEIQMQELINKAKDAPGSPFA